MKTSPDYSVYMEATIASRQCSHLLVATVRPWSHYLQRINEFLKANHRRMSCYLFPDVSGREMGAFHLTNSAPMARGFSWGLFRIFLPFRSVGFCLRAWALGPRLPRQNTAASGSLQRPRFRRRAAHRGQGSGGCAGQRRPWPRDEEFGEENLLEAMGSLREEVDEMLIIVDSIQGFS